MFAGERDESHRPGRRFEQPSRRLKTNIILEDKQLFLEWT